MPIETSIRPPRAPSRSGRPGARVLLITEGTYPHVIGGVSSWCDLLIDGIPEIHWQVLPIVAATDRDRRSFEVPAHAELLPEHRPLVGRDASTQAPPRQGERRACEHARADPDRLERQPPSFGRRAGLVPHATPTACGPPFAAGAAGSSSCARCRRCSTRTTTAPPALPSSTRSRPRRSTRPFTGWLAQRAPRRPRPTCCT